MSVLKRALPLALCIICLSPSAARADFHEYEVESVGASLSSNLAGAHADLTTDFKLKTELGGGDVAQTRDITVTLPPGLLADPTRIPQCTMAELSYLGCPLGSQVGLTEAVLQGQTSATAMPIYNMVPPTGGDVVARLGFFATFYPITINVRVHPEDEYRVTASLEGIASVVALQSATTTIWGVPGSAAHDSERITVEEGLKNERPPGGRPSPLPPAPFLSNPTRCGVALQVSVSADTYQLPDLISTKAAALGALTGCGNLSFEPSVAATPTSDEAAMPTGLEVDVSIRQDETPVGRVSSHLKDATVALPEGMVLSPDAADGLASCDGSQAAYQAHGPAHCPDAAKIGSAELDVVGLRRPLQGAVYQRTPEAGHLFRIWIVADDLGVHVALPGEIEVDKATGQVTTVFSENPQVPLREARLQIFGGPRAPLANPSRCGRYETSWRLVPWSGASATSGSAPMTIAANCDTGAFVPRLSAGTMSPLAGAFAPAVTELMQASGEENISAFDLRLPPGLLASLRGVALCPPAEAETGSCPASSQIGTVSIALGPGARPLWIPQPGRPPTAVYLTGPYKGASYGLAVTVPAQAGPFDLGTVTTRAALEVDPVTARVVVRTDPLPQILEGVPISYRTLRVDIDRTRFTVNPTSCRRMTSTAVLTSAAGATAQPTSPFRVAGCGELAFKPTLSLGLEGGARRGAHPALHASLAMRRREANIASASVTLPHSEFLDQGHIDTVCTRVQFAAEACPPGSIYGHATARSPLLGYPLSGPVYLRSSNHELPDLVAALKGPEPTPLEIDLDGRIDSIHGGIRTTFASVPDAAVSRFLLTMRGGRKGLLQNSTNLCDHPRRARANFTGQNGKSIALHPRLAVSCGKSRQPS